MGDIPRVKIPSPDNDFLVMKISVEIDGRAIVKSTMISKLFLQGLKDRGVLKEMLNYNAAMLLDSSDVNDALDAFTEGE